jgi:lysophospholipase L1-like esterase
MLATMPPVTRLSHPARSVIAALAALPLLAGCGLISSGSPAAQHQAAHGAAVYRQYGTGLAALRAGLTRRRSGPAYYLSLGDSLAQGIQPNQYGQDKPTASGYPDQLARRLRGGIGDLQLVKLGCSGETTSTMIHGGICRYPAGSQLAEATSFLRSHHGEVALITIDIGANDPNSCVLRARPATVLPCMTGRIRHTEGNLSFILARLRAAAGPRVLLVGMTYYVPELGLWNSDPTGKEIAVITDDFASTVNRQLTTRYERYGARVANVFGAFRSADFTFGRPVTQSGGQGQMPAGPVNVSIICALTWMCVQPPQGPNEHANDAGYRVIAGAFWHAIYH